MIGQIDINNAMYSLQNKQLNELKKSSEGALDKQTDEKLKKAATDFEAVFVKQMMDTMNSTVEKSDFLNGGSAEETFRGMLTEQYANNIASSPSTSFGLADQIYRQMKDNVLRK